MFSKAFTAAALVGAVAASPAAVTSAISPQESAPAGCDSSYPGKFEIQIVNATDSGNAKRSTPLVSTLQDGVLTDAQGRTGYIAANKQFQYDGPPQAGAIYTSGFSVCANNSLALGGSTVFYKCLSGTFYNLYDEDIDSDNGDAPDQCSPVYIQVIGSSSGTATTSGAAQQLADGQVTGAPQVACQIGDGQIQDNTCTGAVTQISDGQIQAPSAVAPVTQINDGQIQAPTSTAVSPVTQIADGQIQAPSAAVVSQISDGQIQAPTNGSLVTPTASPAQQFTGAASSFRVQLATVVVGLVAFFAL